MLEALTQGHIGATVCRLANLRRRVDALVELGFDLSDVDEVLAFLGGDEDLQELLDAPLRDDVTYKPGPTRFSDGSWRVFYAALGWETAEAEVGYHVAKAIEGTRTPLYYQRLECAVSGNGYDLRAHGGTWSFLTNPREAEAYPACQDLAREARDNGADALLTLSARLTDGVNAPVFKRAALSDPRIVGSMVIVPDAGGYQVIRQ